MSMLVNAGALGRSRSLALAIRVAANVNIGRAQAQAPCLVAPSAGNSNVRNFSLSSRLNYDEFTKRKSEFRIPGMSDQRVRERHALVVPMIWLYGLIFAVAAMFVMAFDVQN